MVLIRSDVIACYEMQREEESGKTWDEHAQIDGTVTGAIPETESVSTKFIGSHYFDGITCRGNIEWQ